MPQRTVHFLRTWAAPPVGHLPRLRRASVKDRDAAIAALASLSVYVGPDLGTNTCSYSGRTEKDWGARIRTGIARLQRPASCRWTTPQQLRPRIGQEANGRYPHEHMPDPFTVLIMAAGHGTRMRSDTPKVLHRVCGKPMVEWV